MSGIALCLELRHIWNYIVSGIMPCPEIHCVQKCIHLWLIDVHDGSMYVAFATWNQFEDQHQNQMFGWTEKQEEEDIDFYEGLDCDT